MGVGVVSVGGWWDCGAIRSTQRAEVGQTALLRAIYARCGVDLAVAGEAVVEEDGGRHGDGGETVGWWRWVDGR